MDVVTLYIFVNICDNNHEEMMRRGNPDVEEVIASKDIPVISNLRLRVRTTALLGLHRWNPEYINLFNH